MADRSFANGSRRHGFEGLSDRAPAGDLVAFAAPPAGQAAVRGRLTDAAFAAAAAAALGFAPPPARRTAYSAADASAFRLGPDHWLVVDDADAELGRRLEATAGLGAIDMGSARSRLRLAGAAARDLLAVGATIDLRPKAFPAGAFAQTSVGNATAILHARENDVFDVYIARSFAVSWLAWLDRAGHEFGLAIAKD